MQYQWGMLWIVMIGGVGLAQHLPSSGSLSVRQVYRRAIMEPLQGKNRLAGMHLVGRSRVLLESRDHRLFMCDAADGHVIWTVRLSDLVDDASYQDQKHRPTIRSATYQQDGVLDLLLQSMKKTHCVRYDRESGDIETHDLSSALPYAFCELVNRFPSRDHEVLVLVGPDSGRRVGLRAPRGQAVAVFDLKERRPVRHLEVCSAPFRFTSLTWSPDGRYAAAAHDTVHVWDVETGKQPHRRYQPPRAVINEWARRSVGGYSPYFCALSHDSSLLAVQGGDGLLVFDVGSGRMMSYAKAPAVFGTFRLPTWHVKFLTFLGNTEFILGAGGLTAVYDFAGRRWVDRSVLPVGMLGVTVAAVDGDSVFTCSGRGELYRFEWKVLHGGPASRRSGSAGSQTGVEAGAAAPLGQRAGGEGEPGEAGPDGSR